VIVVADLLKFSAINAANQRPQPSFHRTLLTNHWLDVAAGSGLMHVSAWFTQALIDQITQS